MTRPLPAPAGAAGRTRCPGCERRFDATPELPTTTIAGSERAGGRPGYSAAGPGGHERAIEIRWHASCLTDFRAANAAYAERCRLDRREMVETLATAGGLDVAAALAEFDAQNPPLS